MVIGGVGEDLILKVYMQSFFTFDIFLPGLKFFGKSSALKDDTKYTMQETEMMGVLCNSSSTNGNSEHTKQFWTKRLTFYW